MLVFANKTDVRGCMTGDELREVSILDDISQFTKDVMLILTGLATR